MTIHDRAEAITITEVTYAGHTKAYLRAFLNDAELVEKVALAIEIQHYGEKDTKSIYPMKHAKAALDTLKKEAGL